MLEHIKLSWMFRTAISIHIVVSGNMHPDVQVCRVVVCDRSGTVDD